MARILIIDDNPAFSVMLGRLLSRDGFEVETAASPIGVNARLLHPPPIDALVLDCIMPALSGPSLLSLLARNETASRVPVLLVSGAADPGFLQAASNHPHARWVLKQDPMEIVAAVRALVSDRAAPASA